MRVEELIGNLLLRHNCVIIPSFGGFVAKQSAATIDYKNGVMLPPRKTVLFNRQLVNNDGLLVSEFALSNGIFYNVAEEAVRENVVEWNEKLRNGERITFDRIGYLFYDQEKNICFEQDRFFNLLLESFGLGKVHFVAEEEVLVASKQKIEVEKLASIEEEESTRIVQLVPVVEGFGASAQVEEAEDIVLDHPEKKSYRKLWKHIAAAVLLPIGFYSFWIPMKSNVLESGMISFNDFNLTYAAEEGQYTKLDIEPVSLAVERITSLEKEIAALPASVTAYPFSFSDYLNVIVRVPNGKVRDSKVESAVAVTTPTLAVERVEKPKEIPKAVEKKEPIAPREANFSFIVGSYSTEEHANVFISTLKTKGLQGFVLPNGASYRVSTGSANTSAEIAAIADKAKAKGVSGWVLKK
jgi:hypothetical protein